MAAIKHGTLTAATVATVTVDWTDLGTGDSEPDDVEVMNVDGAAAIYYTLDGTTPTVAGDNTFVLPAAICGRSHKRLTTASSTLKLISSGTPKYCVQGV